MQINASTPNRSTLGASTRDSFTLSRTTSDFSTLLLTPPRTTSSLEPVPPHLRRNQFSRRRTMLTNPDVLASLQRSSRELNDLLNMVQNNEWRSNEEVLIQ